MQTHEYSSSGDLGPWGKEPGREGNKLRQSGRRARKRGEGEEIGGKTFTDLNIGGERGQTLVCGYLNFHPPQNY